MSYPAILRDVNNKAIPQKWDPDEGVDGDWIPYEGAVVDLVGKGTVLAGEKSVAAVATPEALAASTACSAVTIQAKIGNTSPVFIGNSTGQYIQLDPGANVPIGVNNLNLIYIKVSVDGEGVNYMGVV